MSYLEKTYLIPLAAQSLSQDLASNLLYWMNFAVLESGNSKMKINFITIHFFLLTLTLSSHNTTINRIVHGENQLFQFTGVPAVVFLREYSSATLANRAMICDFKDNPTPAPSDKGFIPTLVPSLLPTPEPSLLPTPAPSPLPTAPTPTAVPTTFFPTPTLSYSPPFHDDYIPPPPAPFEPASIVSFDQSTSKLHITYSHSKFISYKCYTILNPLLFGYIDTLNGDNFQIVIDMISVTTALSVNLGYLSTSLLELTGQPTSNFTRNGVTFMQENYYDRRYPEMTPITCFNRISGHNPKAAHSFTILCTLQIGSIYTLPVFNHRGATPRTTNATLGTSIPPVYCDCSSVVGRSNYCNVFDLMPALIFFNHENATNIIDLYSSYPSMQAINKLAYNASYSAMNYYNTDNNAFQKQIWSFCGGNCSMLALALYGKFCLQQPHFYLVFTSNSSLRISNISNILDETTQAVSDYFHEVVVGSCANSFYTPSTWSKLANTPPTQLVAICEFFPSSDVLINNVSIIHELIN